MDRGELEDLDRETLVVRAQEAGIRRARILTRPELIDELLRLDPTVDESQLRKSRGFFGRARDLVARVVERGLHLPDAADRIRTMALGTPPSAVPRIEPQAMPTVTLAEIYAAQGHRSRAVETLRRVLEREPDHAAAQILLARLEDEDYVAPAPALPPEPEVEPELSAADDEDDAGDAETIQLPLPDQAAVYGIDGPTYAGTEGEAEFTLLSEPRDEELIDPAHAPTREVPLAPSSAPAHAFGVRRRDDEIDVHAKTDVFELVAEREAPGARAASGSSVHEPSELDAEESDDCVAIPMAGGRMYARWSVSWSTLGRLLGAGPNGRFVVRAHIVLPAWDGPRSETRDLIVDPDDGEIVLQDLPAPSVVRVAVGWLDGPTFAPLAHSPALEMAHGDRLMLWTPNGSVPVALDDPGAAPIARALSGLRRVAEARG